MVLNEMLAGLIRWTLRLVVVAMGAVLFLGVLATACLLAVVWGARLLWARMTGRPLAPWVRVDPRGAWSTATRSTARWTAHAAGSARGTGASGRMSGAGADVTDVQIREIR